ncbi:MAG: DUF2007 domain-containing protein [Bacteroidales bacterium]|nr:DUF2007 domain-containing protein [Bacteroidales bacterium]
MKDNLTLETIAVTNFPAMAEVYRSILEDAGFQVFIANRNAPTYVGLVASVLVQVESSQAEAARQYLKEHSDALCTDQEKATE